MNSNNFKSLSNQFNSINSEYSDTYKIDDIIDIDAVKDDPNALAEEIAKQPSLYAYYLNLKRIAEANESKFRERMTVFEGKKIGYVTDYLKSCGIKNPTSKMIASKFAELFEDNKLYSAICKNLKLWENRKEILNIAIKILDSRESSFKSLSYMLNNLISSGIMPTKRRRA